MTNAIGRVKLAGRYARASKVCLLALAAVLCLAPEAAAQWATNGNDIYNTNTGNVGIGTNAPGNYKVHVFNIGGAVDAMVASFFGSHNIVHEPQTGVKVGTFNNYHNLTGIGETARQAVSLGYSNGHASNITGFYSRQKVWHNDAVANGVYGIAEADASGSAGQRLYGGRFEAKTTDVSGGHNNLALGVFAKATVGTSTNLNHAAYGVVAQAFAGAGTDASVNTYGVYVEGTNSGAGKAFGVYSAAGTNFFSGNVGIGTSIPVAKFQVRPAADLNVGFFSDAGSNFISSYNDANNATKPLVFRGTDLKFQTGLTERFRVSDAGIAVGTGFVGAAPPTNGAVIQGSVGIGTAAPAATLHVAGDIRIDGNIAAKYQDVAEWVPSSQKLAAGMVVVLDTERSNHVLASTTSYDTRVAGVVSAQPGLSLGEAGEGKALVATTGRVKVRVDASRAPVRIGDLLVTSDAPGTAMKSEPMEFGGRRMHAPGTIIGKALEPLEKGVAEILVLLSLQ